MKIKMNKYQKEAIKVYGIIAIVIAIIIAIIYFNPVPLIKKNNIFYSVSSNDITKERFEDYYAQDYLTCSSTERYGEFDETKENLDNLGKYFKFEFTFSIDKIGHPVHFNENINFELDNNEINKYIYCKYCYYSNPWGDDGNTGHGFCSYSIEGFTLDKEPEEILDMLNNCKIKLELTNDITYKRTFKFQETKDKIVYSEFEG
ncbi:MAG: hypothetical protein K6G26_05435 [Lachnospiraceae bacterium]|nr:hypothetical protein [Lachnospiraceae bacterium]